MLASNWSPSSQGLASPQISPTRYASGLIAFIRPRNSTQNPSLVISVGTSNRQPSIPFRSQYSPIRIRYSRTWGLSVLNFGNACNPTQAV